MSIKQLHIICLFLIALGSTSMAQTNTQQGYKIDGDWLIFIFNVEDYSNITDFNIPVNDVFVAGEFNQWSTNAWPMELTETGIYELKKPLTDFTGDFDWEFKFVVNGEHWAEPTDQFENKVQATNKYGKTMMVYNLKLYSAFASKYGNATFNLKGFKDAESVILTGSFNRWDENDFKMEATDTGWTLTLQLRPNRYEYKFIVDGQWISDPNNPDTSLNEYHGLNSVINITKLVEFKLWGQQDAKEVVLSGDFNNWSTDALSMEKKDGYWLARIELPGGKHHYKFIVDGNWITDPYNSVVEYDFDGNINSVCMVK